MNRSKPTAIIAAAAAILALQPASSWACAACYGASDSPLAKGMNWGILSLLGVVVVVLGSVASFFVFLAKKSSAAAADEAAAAQDKPSQPN